MKIKFLSTPIYYANDKPHVGHLYSTLLVDIWKKACALQNVKSFFLTGLDEHGQKVAQSAQSRGYSPKEYVDRLSEEFVNFFHHCDIKYDYWIRTTDEAHEKAVQHFWGQLEKNGYIYKGAYAGWYSISDESYLSEAEAKEVDTSNPKYVWQEEECYYFKLSAFEERLKKFYQDNPDRIYPVERYNETVGFLKQGLKDFVISRPKERLYWGIEVPSDPEHVIYVWIDALVNYLSAIGYPDEQYKNYWPGMHVLGKDILKFHAIYWPALLMAANIELPAKMYIHGWWLRDDAKISKSSGNAFSLDELFQKYKVDGLRYFLVRGVEMGSDGNFREDLVKSVVESELSNKFGNLFLRILGILDLSFMNVLPASEKYEEESIVKKMEEFYEMFTKLPEDPALICAYAKKFIDCVVALNSFFDEKQIWNMQDKNEKASVLYFLLDMFRKIAILIYPIMPDVSRKVLDCFEFNVSLANYDKPIAREFGGNKPVFFPKYNPNA